jgi:hypothetical protein
VQDRKIEIPQYDIFHAKWKVQVNSSSKILNDGMALQMSSQVVPKV